MSVIDEAPPILSLRPPDLENHAGKSDEETGPGPCITWPGALRANGYARIGWTRGGKPCAEYAHRHAWRLFHMQDIPPGHDVHHVCGNRACVEPSHLLLVSRAEHHAIHAAQRTTCRPGLHPWTPENIYISPKGLRVCRQCRHDANVRFRERKAAR